MNLSDPIHHATLSPRPQTDSRATEWFRCIRPALRPTLCGVWRYFEAGWLLPPSCRARPASSFRLWSECGRDFESAAEGCRRLWESGPELPVASDLAFPSIDTECRELVKDPCRNFSELFPSFQRTYPFQQEY